MVPRPANAKLVVNAVGPLPPTSSNVLQRVGEAGLYKIIKRDD